MADSGLSALPVSQVSPAPQASQALQKPVQPVQPPVAPDHPVPTQPMHHISQVNWSHFKLEFAGKPKNDAQIHLLKINDWMDTYAFPEGVKVQQFCLTLVGEARLWYES